VFDQSADGTDQIPVAKCSNCGYIYGDDLDYRFPNPSKCQICGEKTEKTTVADPETVCSLAENGIRADGGSVKDGTEQSEEADGEEMSVAKADSMVPQTWDEICGQTEEDSLRL
jgi:uncharacterized OB-fold protein